MVKVISGWSYAPPSGGISNSTAGVQIAAAPGAGKRCVVDAVQLSATALGAATQLVIRDGAGGTVLWRFGIGLAGLLAGLPIVFPKPLEGSANALLEIATETASVTGAVVCNVQGRVVSV